MILVLIQLIYLRAPLILEKQYDPKFSVDLALKDIQLGVEMAELYNDKTDLSELTLKYMKEASQAGFGKEDCAAVFKEY